MDTILVINAGSSDLRFQIYSVEGEGRLRQRLKGQMDGIGRCPRLRASKAGGGPLANRAYPVETVPDVAAAMDITSTWLRDELHINPIAVGHRVLHGGPEHDRPVLIDHEVMARLERLTRSALLICRTTWRQSVPFWRISRQSRRSPALMPHFPERMPQSPTILRFLRRAAFRSMSSLRRGSYDRQAHAGTADEG